MGLSLLTDTAGKGPAVSTTSLQPVNCIYLATVGVCFYLVNSCVSGIVDPLPKCQTKATKTSQAAKLYWRP